MFTNSMFTNSFKKDIMKVINHKKRRSIILKTLAWNSNWKHAVLEHQIKEIDPEQDLSRSAITYRSIMSATDVDWKKVKDKLGTLKKMDIPVAVSMQAKIDDESAEVLNTIRTKMLYDGNLERLQIPYMIQLLWLNYYCELQEKAQNVGTETSVEDISGGDMFKLLFELLNLNRKIDANTINTLKKILVEWRDKK